MRKLGLVLLMAIAALLVTAGVALAATRTAVAHQHPIGGSGIMGRIHFVDTGTDLHVSGRATGLDPRKTYFSLIYDNGSVDSGPNACEETNKSLTEAQMFVGFWNSRHERLRADKTGPSYTPIGTFATVSIRQLKDPTKPPSEENNILVACGRVLVRHMRHR